MTKQNVMYKTVQGQKNSQIWTPKYASGLTHWYDAADESTITEDTGSVSQWDDKSGNDNHVTQGTAINQPTTGQDNINGLNVITFADQTIGSAVEFLSAANTTDKDWTFIVAQYTYDPPVFSTFVGAVALANYMIQYRPDVDIDRWQSSYFTNGNGASTVGASVITSPTIVGAAQTWSNKTQLGGDRGINSRGMDGYLGEVLQGIGTLTADLRAKIEGYLAWKWRLVGNLPSSHAYKYTPPILGL